MYQTPLAMRELLTVIKENAEPMSALEIGNKLGKQPASISAQLGSYAKEGALKRTRKGKKYLYTFVRDPKRSPYGSKRNKATSIPIDLLPDKPVRRPRRHPRTRSGDGKRVAVTLSMPANTSASKTQLALEIVKLLRTVLE